MLSCLPGSDLSLLLFPSPRMAPEASAELGPRTLTVCLLSSLSECFFVEALIILSLSFGHVNSLRRVSAVLLHASCPVALSQYVTLNLLLPLPTAPPGSSQLEQGGTLWPAGSLQLRMGSPCSFSLQYGASAIDWSTCSQAKRLRFISYASWAPEHWSGVFSEGCQHPQNQSNILLLWD